MLHKKLTNKQRQPAGQTRERERRHLYGYIVPTGKTILAAIALNVVLLSEWKNNGNTFSHDH